MTKHCGSEISKIDHLYYLNDIFSNEIATNLPLPDFATEEIVQQTLEATICEFHMESSTREIQRLRTGNV